MKLCSIRIFSICPRGGKTGSEFYIAQRLFGHLAGLEWDASSEMGQCVQRDIRSAQSGACKCCIDCIYTLREAKLF